MDLFTVVLRTIFFYFFVTLCYRLMGKREVGQLGIIDLIVSILIAELCAISIENIEDSIFLTIIPICILVFFEIVFAFFSMKSRTFRTLFSGKASLIINKGVINYKEMIKQRYTIDDLLTSLRQAGIKSIEEVEFAFLESNGKLSIFKYNFFKLPGSYPLPIIVDGVIQKETLKNIKKTTLWLKLYLQSRQLQPSDVFYAFYKNKQVYIIRHSDVNA